MMTTVVKRWAALVAALGAILVGALGCDNDCASVFRCPSIDNTSSATSSGTGASGGASGSAGSAGTGGGYACPEDPSDGEVREECGIWVSATRGDDMNPGTQAAPVKTIATAIALTMGPLKRIYACGEEYAERVALPAGVSLFGGFSGCSGAGAWTYQENAARAMISGPPDVPALWLLEGDYKHTSLIAEVVIKSPDAKEPGGSSIAVFAPELSRAEFRRCDIQAGKGADGTDGDPGNHNALPAQSGLVGMDGSDACLMDPGKGGVAPFFQCEDGTQTIGGKGGSGGEMLAEGGEDGFPAPNMNPQGYGAGGKGEDPAQGTACTGGINGAQGQKGEDGLGGPGDLKHMGQITLDGHYIGVAGTDGTPGAPGQGGGGGGGSRGKLAVCGAAPPGGAGGGSGGTGGCGGRPGRGGQAGGSSFGIAARGVGLTVAVTVRIVTGNGGKGGNGGKLQKGGSGAFPGKGGMSFGGAGGIKGGCTGGAGGLGGNGGNGGGGRGGHSIAIAATEGAGVVDFIAMKILGEAGPGGDSDSAAGKGAPGTVGNSLPFDN